MNSRDFYKLCNDVTSSLSTLQRVVDELNVSETKSSETKPLRVAILDIHRWLIHILSIVKYDGKPILDKKSDNKPDLPPPPPPDQDLHIKY